MANNKTTCCLALVCLLVSGCATPVRSLYPPPVAGPVKTVYVVEHGWHTGLVVDRADFADTDWVQVFSAADQLEFGWGDAVFYPADEPTSGMLLKAAFWPTPSVLQVIGLTGDLAGRFPDREIIAVELSAPGFDRLREYVEQTFARDEAGQVRVIAAGSDGDTNQFYQARGNFYFPRMCNRWVAAALRAAGCPISPLRVVTAGNVLAQTRKFGTVIQAPAR